MGVTFVKCTKGKEEREREREREKEREGDKVCVNVGSSKSV